MKKIQYNYTVHLKRNNPEDDQSGPIQPSISGNVKLPDINSKVHEKKASDLFHTMTAQKAMEAAYETYKNDRNYFIVTIITQSPSKDEQTIVLDEHLYWTSDANGRYQQTGIGANADSMNQKASELSRETTKQWIDIYLPEEKKQIITKENDINTRITGGSLAAALVSFGIAFYSGTQIIIGLASATYIGLAAGFAALAVASFALLFYSFQKRLNLESKPLAEANKVNCLSVFRNEVKSEDRTNVPLVPAALVRKTDETTNLPVAQVAVAVS